jgi:hypothetical protein
MGAILTLSQNKNLQLSRGLVRHPVVVAVADEALPPQPAASHKRRRAMVGRGEAVAEELHDVGETVVVVVHATVV